MAQPIAKSKELHTIVARFRLLVFLRSFGFRPAFDRRFVIEAVCLRRFHDPFFIELLFQCSQGFIDGLSGANFNTWHGHLILSCWHLPEPGRVQQGLN